jgi:hypothetical protein
MSSTTRYPSLPPEDWDHLESPTIDSSTTVSSTTPSRIAFPSHGTADDSPVPRAPPHGGRAGKRTLSELLKLHAEKGTDVHYSVEEAARLEEVLGQWVCVLLLWCCCCRCWISGDDDPSNAFVFLSVKINSGSSPYEGEDDFFARSQDGAIVLSHRSSTFRSILSHGRGQSESAVGMALES